MGGRPSGVSIIRVLTNRAGIDEWIEVVPEIQELTGPVRNRIAGKNFFWIEDRLEDDGSASLGVAQNGGGSSG